MPTEDRRIIFASDEVYKAIFALCHQKQIDKPPAGRVTVIEDGKEGTQEILIHIENPQTPAPSKMTYSRDFIAAALLRYCKGIGIPVPKNGKKSVLVGEGTITLRVQMD